MSQNLQSHHPGKRPKANPVLIMFGLIASNNNSLPPLPVELDPRGPADISFGNLRLEKSASILQR